MLQRAGYDQFAHTLVELLVYRGSALFGGNQSKVFWRTSFALGIDVLLRRRLFGKHDCHPNGPAPTARHSNTSACRGKITFASKNPLRSRMSAQRWRGTPASRVRSADMVNCLHVATGMFVCAGLQLPGSAKCPCGRRTCGCLRIKESSDDAFGIFYSAATRLAEPRAVS